MYIKLIVPLPCWGGGERELLPIFIDVVSTNILLAMLGFLLSKKGHADFCFKPNGLFFIFFTVIDFSVSCAFVNSLNLTTHKTE